MIYYQDPQCTNYKGDAVEVLKTLPAVSVDMIMTSPPYFGLRKYKAPDVIFDNHNGCEHEFTIGDHNKHSGSTKSLKLTEGMLTEFKVTSGLCSLCGAWRGQLGLEPTPELYIKHLCDIFDACKPVLKKTGTLWVNLDDSYSGSGGTGNQFGQIEKGLNIVKPIQSSMPKKSLIAIPARFQVEMINRGWICRNIIIWHKGNPMPESVKDRFTNDFEYLFMFSQQERYYFEQQFEALKQESIKRYRTSNMDYQRTPGEEYPNEKRINPMKFSSENLLSRSHLGRNKRSVWKINTKGYSGAHFATFPPALCRTPILAGCPEYICSKCGKPRMKVYERGFTDHKAITAGGKVDNTKRLALLRQAARAQGEEYQNTMRYSGLSDCGCGVPFVPGVCMDIFSGSGTLGEEARKLGRKAICIDVSEEYCKMAKDRITKLPLPMS